MKQSVFLGAVFAGILACGAYAQSAKTAVTSATLGATSAQQWIAELRYEPSQLYTMTIAATGCPFIPVDVAGVSTSLMLDTGTARGFLVTTSGPAVPHTVEHREEERNADGSHRGESLAIRVAKLSVLGKVFENVGGSITDWKMFSSLPFNGTVGLDFFLDRRVTLDYKSQKVATTAAPLPGTLDPKRYVTLDVVQPPPSQGHILYARGKVNGRDAIIYIDTGYSASFIDPAFADGLPSIERTGTFRIYRQQVPVDLGGHSLVLDDVRESPINRGPGFNLPVAMTLGSDVLSQFVVTIDLRAGKVVLARAR